MRVMAKYSYLVGADTDVWPLGATELKVRYIPAQDIKPGLTLVTPSAETLHSELDGAYIKTIDHVDSDKVSGSGTVPAELFDHRSRRGMVRFGKVTTNAPVTVTYGIAVAPTANRQFPTCLAPHATVSETAWRSSTKKKLAKAMKRAAKKKRGGWFSRLARGIGRRISGRRSLGEAAFMPEAIEDEAELALGAALDDDAEFESFMGAVTDELFDDDDDE